MGPLNRIQRINEKPILHIEPYYGVRMFVLIKSTFFDSLLTALLALLIPG
jgi:hypothetical protein